MRAPIDQDFGFGKLVKDYQLMEQLDVQIGIGDETVALRAAVHEFGEEKWHETGKGVPERSWLRSGIRLGQQEIAEELAARLGDVVDGRLEPLDAMQRVGEAAVKIVRDRIKTADQWARPLDPAYAATKKGPGILRETLEMLNSVGWRVMRGDTVLREGVPVG